MPSTLGHSSWAAAVSQAPGPALKWPVVFFCVLFATCVLLMALKVVALRKIKTSVNPLVLFLSALWIFWAFGYETLADRLMTQVEGTVISAHDIPFTGGRRYRTEYILRGNDGRDRLYIAGSVDGSLPRSMPRGTHIKKQRWQLSYERNGQRVDDFSLLFHGLILALGLGCLYWSFYLWRRETQTQPN
jgi:hypothetical protein